MIMQELVLNFQRIGFSEKEARVYIASLQLGSSTVNKIAVISKVNRATAYSVLKGLSQKGLVIIEKDKDDIFYSPESPEVILRLLDAEQEELDQRKLTAESLLKRLTVFHNRESEKPKIRYIESVEGLRSMQKEYEAMEEDIIQIVGLDTFRALHGESVSDSHQNELSKSKRKVKSILVTESPVDFSEDFEIDYVCISPDLVSVEGEMSVCGDKLVLFSYSNHLIAVEITSRAIANTARATLELAWKEAGRWGNLDQ